MRQILIVIACIVLLHAATAAAQSAKADVTGTWTFTVQSDAGTSNPTVTFKQAGDKLTGRYSSMLVGDAELTGTVKDQAIEFVVRADAGGMPIELKYAGKLEDKDSMKGTLSTDFGGGTFTAKRK